MAKYKVVNTGMFADSYKIYKKVFFWWWFQGFGYGDNAKQAFADYRLGRFDPEPERQPTAYIEYP